MHEVNDQLPPLAEPDKHLLQIALRAYQPSGLDGENDALSKLESSGENSLESPFELGDRPAAGAVLLQQRVETFSRADSFAAMLAELEGTVIGGVSNDLQAWRSILASERAQRSDWHPGMVVMDRFQGSACEVIAPGMETTVQDWPGRLGGWEGGGAALRPHGQPLLPPGKQSRWQPGGVLRP